MKFGPQVAYKNFEPLYRGIRADTLNLKEYRKNKVHYWPGFTSTSKDAEVAISRSRDDDLKNSALVFEIYVNSQPDSGVPNNIDTSLNKGGVCWSDFEEEKEVLILPNFCFTTLDIV